MNEDTERPVVDLKRTVRAIVVKSPDDPEHDLMAKQWAAPGTCEGHPDQGSGGFLTFACPGCGDVGGIVVGHPKPERSPSWDAVKGSLEDPSTLTLSPSILCKGCCGWHGHLVSGEFQSC